MRIDIKTFFKFSTRVSLKQYEFAVYKYFPILFYKKARVKESDFTLDIVDLSYYTARTLCSYHLTNKELYFDVIASMLSHLNFINSPSNNFLLSVSRYKRLRDFSKSTRIGEMAQGVNTYFVAKRLNFPYIIDFDLAREKTLGTLNIQTNGKTPDFVFLDASQSKIGLYESKGTMNGRVSGQNGYLDKALHQINDVNNPPCFDYKLPICTKFENDAAPILTNKKSSINYALIENKCVDKKDTRLLLKLHYASWFYLVGDFERVQSILDEGFILPILDDDPFYETDFETDKKNPIYWVRGGFNLSMFSKISHTRISLFGSSRPYHRRGFKIGIYRKVIENLISTVPKPTIIELPEGEVNNLRRYPDGTVLYLTDRK